jgi:hypothetical protein
MADSKPARPEPVEAPPPVEVPEAQAPVEVKAGQVVISTRRTSEFVLRAELDDEGKPKGEDLRVTHVGVAVSKKDADRIQKLAADHGVVITVTEKTAIEKKDS